MNGQRIERQTEVFSLYSVVGLAGGGVVVDESTSNQSTSPISPQQVQKTKHLKTNIEFNNQCFKLIYDKP